MGRLVCHLCLLALPGTAYEQDINNKTLQDASHTQITSNSTSPRMMENQSVKIIKETDIDMIIIPSSLCNPLSDAKNICITSLDFSFQKLVFSNLNSLLQQP